MKQILTFLLIPIMLLLAGCPYESDESIDEGSYAANDWLMGSWVCRSGTDSGIVYTVTKDKAQKGVLHASYTEEDGKAENNKLILSQLDNNIFISVYELGDEMTTEGYYLLLLHKINNKEVELWPVNEHLSGAGKTSAEISSFLKTHGNEASTYNKAELLRYSKQ